MKKVLIISLVLLGCTIQRQQPCKCCGWDACEGTGQYGWQIDSTPLVGHLKLNRTWIYIDTIHRYDTIKIRLTNELRSEEWARYGTVMYWGGGDWKLPFVTGEPKRIYIDSIGRLDTLLRTNK